MRATLERANGLLEEARCNEAFDLLQNVCSSSDSTPAAHEMLGRAAAALKRWDISANAYAHVVQQDQASHQTWAGLGSALDEVGRIDSAFKAYNAALTMEPTDTETRTKLAFVSLRLGNIEPALTEFEAAIETRLPQSHPDRTALLSGLKNRDERGATTDETWSALGTALACLDSISGGGTAEESTSLRTKLAGALRDLGYTEAALTQLNLVIDSVYTNSQSSSAETAALHLYRGQLLETADRATEAEGDYRRALELTPQKPEPARQLGRILSSRGHFEEAAAFFLQAICGPAQNPGEGFDDYFGGLSNTQIVEIVIDRDHVPAYEELERLLRAQGQEKEAKLVRDCTRRLRAADKGPSIAPIQTTGADGATYMTDKVTSNSECLAVYEEVFSRFVDQPIVMLELGIYEGGSLLLWRDYFQRGIIVGLDVHPSPITDHSGRIRTYQGYQEDVELLDRIAAEEAPDGYSIVIDDASHRGDLARITFEHVFRNHLKPGGVYVIEDWQSGYLAGWPDGREYMPQADVIETTTDGKSKRRLPSHDFGMVGFVKQLMDQANEFDRILVAKNRVFVFKEASGQ